MKNAIIEIKLSNSNRSGKLAKQKLIKCCLTVSIRLLEQLSITSTTSTMCSILWYISGLHNLCNMRPSLKHDSDVMNSASKMLCEYWQPVMTEPEMTDLTAGGGSGDGLCEFLHATVDRDAPCCPQDSEGSIRFLQRQHSYSVGRTDERCPRCS